MMKRSVRALCSALILLCFSVSALALAPDSTTLYDGIDVSVFQGEIDFSKVRDDGIDIVYIRAGLGSDSIDTRFEENARGAREAGLHFGMYWFMTAESVPEAREQAELFAKTIRGTGYDCRPVMEFGERRGLSTARFNEIGLAFMTELASRTGVTPMLYTDAYKADRVYDARFGAYPLWVADYYVEEPDVTSGHWRGWSGFQYTDLGHVSGIDGRVDRDRFTPSVLLTTPPPTERYVYRTVRTGDTLGAIASEFDTTVSVLASLNDIADVNRIDVGQVLRAPAGDLYFEYTVRAGDTLWALAQRYATTVEILADRNQIADISRIQTGETLMIPNADGR